MAKNASTFFCTDCGNETNRWAGRCPACAAWNTLAAAPEVGPQAGKGASGKGPGVGRLDSDGPVVPPRSLAEFDAAEASPVSTGIPEFDRVLQGGLVPGSLTLVGGEPGVGKSTLLLQALAGWSGSAPGVLVSAEESATQVRARATRLGLPVERMAALASARIDDAVAAATGGGLLVVDSIQTVQDPEVGSAAGSVAQVTRCAQRLSEAARQTGAAIVLVGHITKEGSLAGPRVLEHLVDTVITFDGDPARQLRMLRAVKHRFGPTGEMGLFEMTPDGLLGVEEPGARFLGEGTRETGGSAVAAAVDGHRTLMVEVQALVVALESADASPRWATQGLDSRRLSLLSAVLAKRCGQSLSRSDVYASVAGGARLTDPGADLALCLALASARVDRPLPEGMASFGEVGLGGEIRGVGRAAQRVAEAARLGFRSVLAPASEAASLSRVGRTEVVPVSSLAEALCVADLANRRHAA